MIAGGGGEGGFLNHHRVHAPEVLRDLSRGPLFWFVRLRAIVSLGELVTSVHSVPPLMLGNDSHRLVALRAADAPWGLSRYGSDL